MAWFRYAAQIVGIALFYSFAVGWLRWMSGIEWQLISYFLVLKVASLLLLIVFGWEAVRDSERAGVSIPHWLIWANRGISISALVALFLCLAEPVSPISGFGLWDTRLARWASYSECTAFTPLFLYSLLNVFIVITRDKNDALRNKTRQYLIFTDLPCVVPAVGLLFLVWLGWGVTTQEGKLVLAAGAATLIFASNAAVLAINELTVEQTHVRSSEHAQLLSREGTKSEPIVTQIGPLLALAVFIIMLVAPWRRQSTPT